MAKTPAWQRKEGKDVWRGRGIMARCSDLTHTSSDTPGIRPQLFAQSVGRTSPHPRIMPTANVATVPRGIAHTVKIAVSKGVGNIGRALFMLPYLLLMRSCAKFVELKNHYQSSMPTGVFQTARRSTAVAASCVCWSLLKKKTHKRMQLSRKSGHPHQKTLSLASLTMQQTASNIWGLTWTLGIFCSFTTSSKGYVPCRGWR